MVTFSICGILIINLFAFNNTSNPYELYSIGCQLELEGKIYEAIDYYLKALKKDTTAKEIYLSITNAYYKIREFDKGIAYAFKGLSFVKDSSEVYGLIAAGYIGKGDFGAAIKIYEKIRALKPGDINIIQAIALLYEGLGNLDSAKNTLLTIPESLRTADIYNRLGTLAGKSRNHTEAIDYYKKALKFDTLNVTALLGIGTGFDIMEKKDSAIYYYEIASRYSNSIDLKRRLIDLYGDTEQYEKLITIAREILDTEYYDAFVRRSLGFALYKMGHFDESLSEFLISAGLNPRDDYSRFYIARINLERKRYDEAKKAIEEAIKINPDFIELWVYAGFIALDQKDYENARYYFTEAAHRNADMAQIYYLLGVTFELDSNYKEAYFNYKKSIELNPKSLPGLSAFANLCDRIGKKEEALHTFEKIILLDSTDATALNYVGYTYAEKGEKLDSALKLIEKALSIEPNNGYIIDSRGWVYYQKGDYESALNDLKRASELVEDAIILEHLGDVYIKLNDIERAIEVYKKILTIEPENKRVKNKLLNLKGE
jgi:tetratricopeptide (TPR) repeat protein|uniref:Tetratricopeptide repeat protein n=1 Tax=candidate division WOR-3 bacterium TaxID=2052148 RepID=A0A7V3VU68_UNCW3